MIPDSQLYGLLVELEEPDELIAATHRAREEGYEQIGTYTPFPMEELEEAMGLKRTRLPIIVLIGGICGCVGGFMLQYWTTVLYYPLNVGGRPFNTWPMYIPVTFELTILAAALSAVLGMLALNGLPQPYHPLFNVPEFERATQDRFFLCVQSRDPKFDREKTRAFLKEITGKEPIDVPL